MSEQPWIVDGGLRRVEQASGGPVVHYIDGTEQTVEAIPWPDHVAALAQAEQRIADQAAEVVEGISWNKGYEQGQRDALAKLDALDECYQQDNDWSNGWHEALKAMRPIKGDSDA